MAGEIFVVTASGTGHLFPSIELCYHISCQNYKTHLVLPSSLSSSVPSSFLHSPLLTLAEITPTPFSPNPDSNSACKQAGLDLEAHISKRLSGPNPSRPLCAVVDFPMGWTKQVFWKFDVPVISFFTFGACVAAMEHGAWKVQLSNANPGQTSRIPGLPEEMELSHSDTQPRPRSASSGGPKLWTMPPWVPAIEGSIGLMFNTCQDLERPFLEYMSREMGMPIWGVGPLLPERFWAAVRSDSLSHDHQVRQQYRERSINDEELVQWLDSQQHGSVLYVAFGTTVRPTEEDYHHLASALEDCYRPYIWITSGRSGDGPDATKIDIYSKGLMITGWVPQLLMLSHPSTGGFLSHCGWNSTIEAIGLGVPILGWPIRGDQHLNAKLVVLHLKMGHMACERGPGEMVRRI